MAPFLVTVLPLEVSLLQEPPFGKSLGALSTMIDGAILALASDLQWRPGSVDAGRQMSEGGACWRTTASGLSAGGSTQWFGLSVEAVVPLIWGTV
jgi:hypothetical protein